MSYLLLHDLHLKGFARYHQSSRSRFKLHLNIMNLKIVLITIIKKTGHATSAATSQMLSKCQFMNMPKQINLNILYFKSLRCYTFIYREFLKGISYVGLEYDFLLHLVMLKVELGIWTCKQHKQKRMEYIEAWEYQYCFFITCHTQLKLPLRPRYKSMSQNSNY